MWSVCRLATNNFMGTLLLYPFRWRRSMTLLLGYGRSSLPMRSWWEGKLSLKSSWWDKHVCGLHDALYPSNAWTANSILSLSLSHTHTHTHTHTQRNTRTRRYVLNSRDLTSNTSSSTSTTRISSSSSGDANITDTTDSPLTNSGGNPMAELTEDEVSFCTRFQLSHEEVPLPSWRAGRRCSLLDRNRPLSLTKSGKLFLTHRYM